MEKPRRTKHENGALKPVIVDIDFKKGEKIQGLADAGEPWVELSIEFILAALPEYLGCIVTNTHFLNFLQKNKMLMTALKVAIIS